LPVRGEARRRFRVRRRGAAFWPDTPEGCAAFRLHRLRIDKPVPVESSYMLGGGEYPDFSRAW
jgi:hypothetical protein